MKKVLSLCDFTGNMVRPWLESGWECWIVDIQHPEGVSRDGKMVRVGCDVRDFKVPDEDFCAIFSFPPCTDLSVSGARWFKNKGLRALSEAIDIFGSCVNICEGSDSIWMIENPVSVISSHYRKPDYIFDPCDYGDPWTKKTCLWTGGGFVMPEKNRVEPTMGSMMHRLPPSKNRGHIRSVTPMGFSKAVFHSNGGMFES